LEEDGAPFDSGFDDTGPFRVSPESGGVSLEAALRDFGPAAIDDLIPRIRAIAKRLDAAHRAGVVHGALQPSKVFVTDDATEVIAGTGAHAPYAAPEVIAGHGATPPSDQYSLAAIAFEWLFGRPITHAGDRPIEVRSMPGVDRPALSKAFTRALAPKPDDRFASCAAFCDALAGAVVPELPLLADVDDFEAEQEPEPDPSPISAADLAPFDSERESAFLAQDRPIVAAPNVDDVKIVAEESFMTAAQPDLDAIAPLSQPPPVEPPFDSERDNASLAQGRVPSWNPSATSAARETESPRFGPVALFLALIVGAVAGFAAGYMAVPRALQTQAPGQMAVQAPGTAQSAQGARGARGAQSAQGAPSATQTAPAPSAPRAPGAPRAPSAPRAPEKPGRLLIRSSPSGASVSVDGVAKGETPIALRDLDIGTRSVTIARRGYLTETRRVSITKARPARTLDIRLSAAAATAVPATPRPSTPATLGKSAVPTGSLAVDSRPTGAAVTINGKPSGATPITINDLEPGEYRILMTMPGYRNFATTVRVVAGERARAAASLTAVEQE